MRYPALVWQRPGRLPRRFDGVWFKLLLVVLGLALAASMVGWVSLPRVVGGWINLSRYQALVGQRERLGRRYAVQVDALTSLQPHIAVGLETSIGLRQLLGVSPPAGISTSSEVSSLVPETSIYVDLANARVQAERAVRLSLGQWQAELSAVEGAVGDGQQLAMVPTILPLSSDRLALSSDFGRHRDPLTEVTRFHNGMLLATPRGATVIAPADGRVAFTGVFRSSRSPWQRLGRMVVLRHGEDFISILGHCSDILVSRGEQVERAQPVAESGDTGLTPHPGVYYELRRYDPALEAGEAWVPVDPKFYILDHSWGDELSRRRVGVADQAPEYDPLPWALRR